MAAGSKSAWHRFNVRLAVVVNIGLAAAAVAACFAGPLMTATAAALAASAVLFVFFFGRQVLASRIVRSDSAARAPRE
jgi:hypothetical protein